MYVWTGIGREEYIDRSLGQVATLFCPGCDSSVANRFVAAHQTRRWCSPGDAGSDTCRPLSSPRVVRRVVIHTLAVRSAETWISAASQGPPADLNRYAGAHYVVDRNGTITQLVRENDVAFHAGDRFINRDSIGIEHADVCNDPEPYTTHLYERSAQLVRDIAGRHGFRLLVYSIHTMDRNIATIIGHDHIGGHSDPGPYWDWEYYSNLLYWDGRSMMDRPIRLVTMTSQRPNAPSEWQVRRRRSIPNTHCANRNDPYGASFWRAQPSATGASVEFSLIVNDPGLYKVSLWWPNVASANSAVPVDAEVLCLASPCLDAFSQTATINQRSRSGRWNDVGASFTVTTPPVEVRVRIRRNTATRGWILADAVRVLKIGSVGTWIT